MTIFAPAISYMLSQLQTNISEFLTFIFICLLLRFIYLLYKRGPLPPGPYGVPLFGYMPFIKEDLHIVFDKLSGIHGNIFSMYMGNQLIAVITDPKTIRTLLSKEEFSDKPSTTTYSIFENYGIVNVNGYMWKQQRRFVHENLRNLGMKSTGYGREQMEEKIMPEVRNLIEILASYNEKDVSVVEDFTTAAGNVVCSFIMSIRFTKTNPVYQRFMKLFSEGFKLFTDDVIDSYLPKIKSDSNSKMRRNKLKSNHSETMNMVNMFVKNRRKVYDSSVSRDLLDAYLHQEQSGKFVGDKTDKDHSRQILQVMNDLFSSGQETVAGALSWSIVYLLRNPSIVENIQNDLDQLIGRNRLPTLSDIPQLPYLEATIYEVLRISTIFPIAPPHIVSKDVYVDKYFLPKGTMIYPNLYSCHMSEKFWTRPEQFDPNRFLDKNRNIFRPSAFMAFGAGRRMCVAETLARSEIFLFISSILHVFNLKPSSEGVPSTKGQCSGVSRTPEPFKVCFEQREVSVLNPLVTKPQNSTIQ